MNLTRESFTIKSLKVNERMSEETLSFTAVICVDGKPAFEAMNHGHGGATMISPLLNIANSRELLAEAEAWAKSEPPLPCEFLPDGLPMNFELFVDILVGDTHTNAKLIKHCKRKLVFRLPADDEDSYRTLNAPYSADAKAFVLKQYPDAIILNETLGLV